MNMNIRIKSSISSSKLSSSKLSEAENTITKNTLYNNLLYLPVTRQIKRYCQGACSGSSYPCKSFLDELTGYDSTTTSGVQIQGYYFWCYNQPSIINSWCSNSYGSVGSATWTSTMTTNVIPSGTNMVLFQYGTAAIGYSNYFGTTSPAYGPGMLQYVSYPSSGTSASSTPYNLGVSWLQSNASTNAILDTGLNYLVGIMFGGGGDAVNTNVAYWTSSTIAAIQDAIEAGSSSSSGLIYSATPTTVSSGYGMTFNLLAFDIEVGDPGLLEDFQSLFQAARDAGFLVMVIFNHTCSYGISDAGTTLLPGLFKCPYVNFISPEIYTENIGTMNEYVANTQIPWMGVNSLGNPNASFESFVRINPNYKNGQILLPSILLYNSMPYSNCGGLYYSGGTNTGNPPNWTSYDGSGSGCTCDNPQVASSGNQITNYPPGFTTNPDPGANTFLCNVFGCPSIGGAVQWVNGSYQG
jgi:hypothetical protein